MINISSPLNPQFKKAKALHLKKFREKEGQFLLEGYRYIKTALELGHVCRGLFVSSDDEKISALMGAFPLYRIEENLFRELSQTETTQGVIGIFDMPASSDLSDISDQGQILYLDRIQDPGNMGTMIRTADAAGIKTICLGKGCVDVYNDKTIRSAAGSILNVSFCMVSDVVQALDQIKALGFTIVVTALEDSEAYDAVDLYGDKNCLVIGNEANGVQDLIKAIADVRVKIPIDGLAESLNAAIAAGIMMYKIREHLKSK